MNRYVASGLVADMQAGLRVLFVAENIHIAREAMRQTEDANSEPIRIKWSRGTEKLASESGGFVRFVSVHSKSHRGLVADKVVLHGDIDPGPYLPCVASTGGEVIRL